MVVRYIGHHSRSGAILGLTPEDLKVGAAARRLEKIKGGVPRDIKNKSPSTSGERVQAPRTSSPPAPDTRDARAFYVSALDAGAVRL